MDFPIFFCYNRIIRIMKYPAAKGAPVLTTSISRKSIAILRVLLPCLCAGAVLLAVYAAFGLYPFGIKSISWCDMDQQTIPLMAEFRRALLGEGSFFRSPGAGGINAWGILFFFMSSPFSLLSVLVEPQALPWLMNLLFLGKVMTCAGTSAIFFRRFFRTGPSCLMAVLYAFSGFSLLYYQNLVWLDMMALFPLLLLALRTLWLQERLFPFVAAFSAMLVVNYYLSFMVVLFLLLPCAVAFWLCCPETKRRKTVALLCCGAVLSVILTAVVWVPSLLEVLASARENGVLVGIGSGKFLSQIETTLPTILTSAFPFAAVCLLNRKLLSSRKFLALGASVLLLLIPMVVRPINCMWHTGSYQGFPTRYGYMAGLLLLLLAGWIMQKRVDLPGESPSVSIPAAILAFVIPALFALGMAWLLANELEVLSAYVQTLWGNINSLLLLLAVTLTGICCYLLLFMLYRSRKINRQIFSLSLSMLVFIECFFQTGVYVGAVNNTQDGYVQAIELLEQLPEDGFYRVKTEEKYFDVNDFSAAGVESLSHYTSLTPESTLGSQRRLGYSGYWMELNSNGGTAFSDAVLANQYQVTTAAPLEDLVVEPLPYTFPDTLITTTEPGFLLELPAGSRMGIQRQLANALFPESEELFVTWPWKTSSGMIYSGGIYAPIEGETGVLTWEISIDDPVVLYFDCASAPTNALREPVNNSCRIWVNGKVLRGEYPTQRENGILCLGEFEQETVQVRVEINRQIQPESLEVFGLKKEVLESMCRQAKGASLEGSGDTFTVNCTAQEGETLFVPLAWDQGWSATCNGEPAELYQTAGGYLSLALKEGENRITLTYIPPGWKAGLWVSIAGLVAAVLFFLFGKKKLLASPGFCKVISMLYVGAATVAGAMVYLFPVAWWCVFHIMRW